LQRFRLLEPIADIDGKAGEAHEEGHGQGDDHRRGRPPFGDAMPKVPQ
jgi:hypothetical protein